MTGRSARSAALIAMTGFAFTGGPDSPPPPADRSVYGALIAEHKADVMLTYCSNALAARRENATLAIVEPPDALAVGASYGITVMAGASPRASRFVQFVLADDGQRILARHGFGAPGSP